MDVTLLGMVTEVRMQRRLGTDPRYRNAADGPRDHNICAPRLPVELLCPAPLSNEPFRRALHDVRATVVVRPQRGEVLLVGNGVGYAGSACSVERWIASLLVGEDGLQGNLVSVKSQPRRVGDRCVVVLVFIWREGRGLTRDLIPRRRD